MLNNNYASLGKVVLHSKDSQLRGIVDAMAVETGPNDEVLLLSLVAPMTTAKAFAAALTSRQRVSVVPEDCPPLPRGIRCSRGEHGYDVHRHRLGFGLWQTLFITRRPGFIPSLDDDTIWSVLQGDQYTTPMLREWIPFIRQELTDTPDSGIRTVTCYRCNVGLLAAADADIDRIVSAGVASGRLNIPEAVSC